MSERQLPGPRGAQVQLDGAVAVDHRRVQRHRRGDRPRTAPSGAPGWWSQRAAIDRLEPLARGAGRPGRRLRRRRLRPGAGAGRSGRRVGRPADGDGEQRRLRHLRHAARARSRAHGGRWCAPTWSACSTACGPPASMLMRQGRGGGIVNVSSIVGEFPDPGSGAYAATKAAVDLLSRTGYRELRDHGIHVVNVKPALTDTEFSAVARGGRQRRMGGDPPEKVARWICDALESGSANAGLSLRQFALRFIVDGTAHRPGHAALDGRRSGQPADRHGPERAADRLRARPAGDGAEGVRRAAGAAAAARATSIRAASPPPIRPSWRAVFRATAGHPPLSRARWPSACRRCAPSLPARFGGDGSRVWNEARQRPGADRAARLAARHRRHEGAQS